MHTSMAREFTCTQSMLQLGSESRQIGARDMCNGKR
jgi:hypothetical protein